MTPGSNEITMADLKRAMKQVDQYAPHMRPKMISIEGIHAVCFKCGQPATHESEDAEGTLLLKENQEAFVLWTIRELAPCRTR